MLSIFDNDLRRWTAPESLPARYRELLGLTDVGRTTYFLPAVQLTREDVLRLDLVLLAAMSDAGGSPVTMYTSVRRGGRVVDKELETVLRSSKLPDTFHDLRFKYKGGRRRVHLILSRRKVQLKIFCGPGGEAWKRQTLQQVKEILGRRRARFLKTLFASVLVMFLSLLVMFAAAFVGARFIAVLVPNVVAVVVSFFVALPLFVMHHRGVYLPHAEITLVPRRGGSKGWGVDTIISLASLLVEFIEFIIKVLYRTVSTAAARFRAVTSRVPQAG